MISERNMENITELEEVARLQLVLETCSDDRDDSDDMISERNMENISELEKVQRLQLVLET